MVVLPMRKYSSRMVSLVLILRRWMSTDILKKCRRGTCTRVDRKRLVATRSRDHHKSYKEEQSTLSLFSRKEFILTCLKCNYVRLKQQSVASVESSTSRAYGPKQSDQNFHTMRSSTTLDFVTIKTINIVRALSSLDSFR